jgi:hypothetical protein
MRQNWFGNTTLRRLHRTVWRVAKRSPVIWLWSITSNYANKIFELKKWRPFRSLRRTFLQSQYGLQEMLWPWIWRHFRRSCGVFFLDWIQVSFFVIIKCFRSICVWSNTNFQFVVKVSLSIIPEFIIFSHFQSLYYWIFYLWFGWDLVQILLGILVLGQRIILQGHHLIHYSHEQLLISVSEHQEIK